MDIEQQKQLLKERFDLDMQEITIPSGRVFLVISGPKISLEDGREDHAWEVRALLRDVSTPKAVRSYCPYRNRWRGLTPQRHDDFVTAVAHAMSESERAGLGAKESV